MSTAETIKEQLIALSRQLGDPALDLAILGEGNSSAKIDDNRFYVKASGSTLASMTAEGLVECQIDKILAALDGDVTDGNLGMELLKATKTDPSSPAIPSVEGFLHGFLLSLPDVNFIGHTHPTAVLSILCSNNWQLMEHSLFPDQIVCCGLKPCMIEYTDPGLHLARKLRQKVQSYIRHEGDKPKLILMQNHGIIALGSSPKEVMSISMMAVKTARVMIGGMGLSGLNPLDPITAQGIAVRPDEKYRSKMISAISKD